MLSISDVRITIIGAWLNILGAVIACGQTQTPTSPPNLLAALNLKQVLRLSSTHPRHQAHRDLTMTNGALTGTNNLETP